VASLDSSLGSEPADFASVQSDAALVQRGLNIVDILGVGGNSIVIGRTIRDMGATLR
jgi:hypothetical protein